MKETPLLFTYSMVRAVLRAVNPKTQTRRLNGLELVNSDPNHWTLKSLRDGIATFATSKDADGIFRSHDVKCPYGQEGDRLWVREAWAESPAGVIYKANYDVADGFGASIVNMKTGELSPLVWKSPRFMFKKYARLWLEVTRVRVERLHGITNFDILNEGIVRTGDGFWLAPLAGVPDFPWQRAELAFCALWDSINAKRGLGWNFNPWVWVVEFKRIPTPFKVFIDSVPKLPPSPPPH